MGGAVFAALDGETYFASAPQRIESTARPSNAGERAATRKSDKLPQLSESNTARQVIRISTASRVGDREIMRVVPHIRVTSNLALSTTDISANIPAFNAQRLMVDAGSEGAPAQADDAPAAEPDAEVSFVTRDLAAVLPKTRFAGALPIDDVLARVREVADRTGSIRPQRYAVAGMQAGLKLAYAVEGDPDPYAGFEARIVPENITLLPKTGMQTTGGNSWSERLVIVKKGESIGSILRDLGVTPDDAKTVAAALGARGRDGGLKEGQRLRILLGTAENSQRQQPIRRIIANDSAAEAAVALSDSGKFVPVDVQSINTEMAEAGEDEEDDDGSGVRLYQSIYETGLRHQVPRPVIESLLRIFSYDVDFQRKV